jgi:intracellular multiplication protein IcmL
MSKSQRALELVIQRNTFYRDNYKRVSIVVLILLAINCILGGLIFYKFVHTAQPEYFATTAGGRIIKVHQLTDPVVPDDFVTQWAADSVHKAFSLDYIHWKEQLQAASDNFTPDGWHWFSASLKSTNNLKTLSELSMVSNATVTGSPQIIQKAIIGGHYAWKIQMPLLVTYTNPGKTINMPMKVTIIVIRMPVQDNPQRIAINNFIAETVNPTLMGR